VAASALDRDTILRAIAAWPVEEQVMLAQSILERAIAHSAPRARSQEAETQQRSTWEALYGIASNGQEPPSDEQVAQWLDDHRMEKYGR
jgi:uncharacterized membrane protein